MWPTTQPGQGKLQGQTHSRLEDVLFWSSTSGCLRRGVVSVGGMVRVFVGWGKCPGTHIFPKHNASFLNLTLNTTHEILNPKP